MGTCERGGEGGRLTTVSRGAPQRVYGRLGLRRVGPVQQYERPHAVLPLPRPRLPRAAAGRWRQVAGCM